jgi:hypothetical protein
MSLRAVSFQMHDANFTAKYCHYRRNSVNIEGCERPSNILFSWEIMTNSRFLAGFVISRSSVRARLPARLNGNDLRKHSPLSTIARLDTSWTLFDVAHVARQTTSA